MKLKRLIVHGFKSFKDRTTIHFDDGITGIVGPNGCGKSNIVDALFWVMGEQSAKHLRGNSMKDLIFSGSSKYSPGTWAEVSLVLENDEGKHIHIGNKVSSPSEIQLTRKLYRNSETEYRINGTPCRLRDIQEVFMDTGAGAKSYSIIAQGEINRLVQAKPVERRTMIEEVAGITKFKMRKRESLRKIEQTQANINRLTDLKNEIEKNLASLKKQAEKAERARNLKEKVKRNDLVVSSHQVFDFLKSYREGKSTLNEKSLEIESWKTEKENIEVGLQEERLEKDSLTEQIEKLQGEYNEISRKLAGAEERLNSLCDSQTEKEKQVQLRENELNDLKADVEERKQKKIELEAQKEELENENEGGHDYSDLEEQVDLFRTRLNDDEEVITKLRAELEAKAKEVQELDQKVFRNTSRQEEFAAQLQDTTTEIEQLENQFSGVSTEIASEREEVNQLQASVDELSQKVASLREELSENEEVLKTNTADLQTKIREVIQTESKLHSLRDIRAALEGVKEGTTEFLNDEEAARGHEILGGLIQCDEEYTAAVQAALGDLMEALVNDEESDNVFTNWIANHAGKGADYIVPKSDEGFSSEVQERLELANLGQVTPLKEVIRFSDSKWSHLVALFEGHYIVESTDPAAMMKVGSDVGFKAIVNRDGSFMVKNHGAAVWLKSVSSQQSEQGAVARNNKILELEKELALMNEEKLKLEEVTEQLREKVDVISKAYEQNRENLSATKESYASKKSALESKVQGFDSQNSRLEILKNRKAEVSKNRLTLLEEEEVLKNQLAELRESKEELEESIQEKAEMLDDLRSQYEEKKEELVEKQIQAKTFEDRVKGVKSQLEDLSTQIEKSEKKLESTTNLIQEYRNEIDGIAKELEDIEKGNLATAEDLKAREAHLNEWKEKLAKLLKVMQEREDRVKKLAQDINKNEKHVVELEVKMNQYLTEEEQVVRDIFEKYRVDLRKVIGRYLEFEESDYEDLNDLSAMYLMETEAGTKEIQAESYEFHRRYGQDLKDCKYKLRNYKTEVNRLGEINWQAIEDYDRQKLRFDFLQVQERELKQSLEDLEKAIEHIDAKSRERFKIAFEEVNMRFQKVFPIIFGGGTATLRVTGDLDDAECGVDIIAQPPGKKMQNINLMSGGEKALTAVSLIFSIFLVKPSPFCLLDEVDAPLDDANVGRFNELLREMSAESQFILITHNKKTMELNDTLYGVTMQEPGISKAVSVQLH